MRLYDPDISGPLGSRQVWPESLICRLVEEVAEDVVAYCSED